MGVDIHVFLEYKPEKEKEYKIVQFFNEKGFVKPFDERDYELFDILKDNFAVRGLPSDVSPEIEEKYIEGLDKESGINFYYGATYIYFDELYDYLKKHRTIKFYNEEIDQWDETTNPLNRFYTRLYFYMNFAIDSWSVYDSLDFRNTRVVFWFDH